jgi:GTP pyrophosphokinase
MRLPSDEHLVKLAHVIAEEAHRGQKRWDGRTPYFDGHVLKVANAVASYGDVFTIVALLHDVVEDCDVSLEEVEENFGADIAQSVNAMTRRGEHTPQKEHYVEYIKRVRADPIARVVKQHDIRHNLSTLPRNNRQRREKYELAIAYLEL